MLQAQDNHLNEGKRFLKRKVRSKTAPWALGVFNKYFCLLIYRNNPPTGDHLNTSCDILKISGPFGTKSNIFNQHKSSK